MSIFSSPFGPTILSGEDAKKFMEQIQNPSVNHKDLNKSLERGRELLAAMLKHTGE